MKRRSSGPPPERRGLRLPGQVVKRTSGVAAAISLRSRSLALGRSARPTPRPEPTIADLRRHAEAALVAADDALLASAEELATLADPDLPAGLRCSEEEVAPFGAALEAAQADMDTACLLRERAARESDPEMEADLLGQVEQLCRSAGARLDEQSRAFDAVRNLDRSVVSVLPALKAKVQLLRQRLTEAVEMAGDLATRFPSDALASARSDLAQASDRVDFAEDSLGVAGDLLRTGDRRGAIARVRAAEAAMRQANLLLEELASVPDELSRAAAATEVLLAQTRSDLAQVRRLATLAPSAPPIRFASATVEWAAEAVASPRVDPIATRRALLNSDSALVRALGEALDPTAARRRAEALVDCCADAAGNSLRGASIAVLTRRAVVGAEARLRLAAARRLVSSSGQDEPVSRVDHLQQADRLAEEARALAQSDEARAHDRVTLVGGPVTHKIAAAVVGGILVRTPTDVAQVGAEEQLGGGGAPDPAAAMRRFGQMAAVSFGGLGTRARRGGAGRF